MSKCVGNDRVDGEDSAYVVVASSKIMSVVSPGLDQSGP